MWSYDLKKCDHAVMIKGGPFTKIILFSISLFFVNLKPILFIYFHHIYISKKSSYLSKWNTLHHIPTACFNKYELVAS